MSIETTAVLEIGTSTVRVVVGELRKDGVVSVTGIGEAESRGIRKGEITNRDHAIASVRKAIKAAEESRGRSIHSVLLTTSGGQAESKTSTGILKLVDFEDNQPSEISEEDIDEVIEVARKVALPENRIKLHTLQQYFQVDDMLDVASPVGLAGEELRLDMLTIHGKRSTVDNFRKMGDRNYPIAQLLVNFNYRNSSFFYTIIYRYRVFRFHPSTFTKHFFWSDFRSIVKISH